MALWAANQLLGQLRVAEPAVPAICRQYHPRELALFGSAVRGELRPDSDVDVLVELLPTEKPTYITLGHLDDDLERLFGRPVDVIVKSRLNPIVCDEVVGEATVLYAAE